MSLGFGVSDIVAGLKLCIDIKDRCLTVGNRVDVQYRELARDVRLLEDRLGKLMAAVSKVSTTTGEEALPILPDEDGNAQRSVQLLEKESKELIGDFNTTLIECKNFLYDNRQYERRAANALVNFTDGPGVISQVNSLRSRVLFHMQKIDLVLLPVQLELLAIINDRVIEAIDRLDEIRDLLKTQMGQPRAASALPEIPASISEKFKSTLQENRPATYLHPESIPLKEGFDALYRHYRDSTLQFKNAESSPQTLEQYLNLLKAHWLLVTLKSSKTYSDTRPSSLYRQAIGIVEKRIAGQYARSHESVAESERVVRFGEQELAGLEDAAFAIWRPQPKPRRQIPTQPNLLEEEMLKLSLPVADGYQNRELIFFRVNQKVIRLVETRTTNEATPKEINDQHWINIHEDGLVPWYTIGQPNADTGKFLIGLSNSRGAGTHLYELESLKDVLRFQRAFTGYLVAPLPMDDVKCSYSVLKGKRLGILGRFEQHDGSGSIQFWMDSPLPAATNQTLSPGSSQVSIGRKDSALSQAGRSRNPSIMGSRRAATLSIVDEKSNRTVVIPKMSFPSAFVAFTLSDEVYTIWFTEFKAGMTITEKKRSKARIVIRYKPTPSTDRPFTTRKISFPKDELGDCNLAIFGLPRHPLFEDRRVVQELECDFLSLRFRSSKRMDEFAAHFEYAVENEVKRTGNIRRADMDARLEANRPKNVLSVSSGSVTGGSKGSQFRPQNWSANGGTPAVLASGPPNSGDVQSGRNRGTFKEKSELATEKLEEADESGDENSCKSSSRFSVRV